MNEPLIPPVSSQEALQREIAAAEQLHRSALRDFRRRRATAIAAAAAVAQRLADQEARHAEAWRVLQDADARAEADRPQRHAARREEIAHQRQHEATATYAVNFLETYRSDAYYLDAIEPYTWR